MVCVIYKIFTRNREKRQIAPLLDYLRIFHNLSVYLPENFNEIDKGKMAHKNHQPHINIVSDMRRESIEIFRINI